MSNQFEFDGNAKPRNTKPKPSGTLASALAIIVVGVSVCVLGVLFIFFLVENGHTQTWHQDAIAAEYCGTCMAIDAYESEGHMKDDDYPPEMKATITKLNEDRKKMLRNSLREKDEIIRMSKERYGLHPSVLVDRRNMTRHEKDMLFVSKKHRVTTRP